MVDLERQLVITAAAEHGDLRRRDLDVAGGELRVFAGALAHDAHNGNRGFLIEGLYNVHHLFVFDDDLRGAVEIAQHQKRKVIADFADVFLPLLIRLAGAQVLFWDQLRGLRKLRMNCMNVSEIMQQRQNKLWQVRP